MRRLGGQIISLTKNIWLRQPETERSFPTQFFVGRRNPFAFTGGIGTTWWYTKSSWKAVEAVASLIVETHIAFKHCDLETVERTVKDTLKEICVEQQIFNPDEVCFPRKATLFECRAVDEPAQFSSLILAAIVENLSAQMTARCTVYVAPRIKGPSFHIPNQRISVLGRFDASGWNAIVNGTYSTDGWTPETGKFARRDDLVFSKLKYDYVFVCEEVGTHAATVFSCELKLRRLIAVMFSFVSSRRAIPLTTSMADPYELCIQFSATASRESTVITNSLGALLPYYGEEHVLTNDDVSAIQAWFETTIALPNEQASRIEKCAHFINRAMNSADIEAYVNYFVALDALFGQRNAVESSIVTGLADLCLEADMLEKVSWLFDLRNELVHGGSRYAKEWPKYRRYYRHFDSRPEHDIEALAFSVLRQAPTAFARQR